MTDTILSAKGKPFKLERHALAAISTKSGYHVVKTAEGFVGMPMSSDAAPAGWEELNIVCPGCAQVFFSATDKYDPERNANPAMIQLNQPYKGYGWDELPKDPTMGYGCLVCPDCGAALAPSGKLRTK